MVSAFIGSLLGLAVLGAYWKLLKWRQNYRTASQIGLPVFYSPIYLSDIWWLIFQPMLVPILERLPQIWTSPWLGLAQVFKVWKVGHRPFQEAGGDTFVLATPNGNMIWTCDLGIIHQLFTLHPKVEQPVELLKFFDLWGPTIGSVDGDTWKANRRAVTAGFGSGINKIVWNETKYQTEALITHWIKAEGSVIDVMREWTVRLALHVLSSGFFNHRLEWDGRVKISVPFGHTMTFDEALPALLKHLGLVYVTPKALLDKLPGKMFKEAHTSFTEVTRYFHEFYEQAASNIQEIAAKRYKSILEAIAISAADEELTGKTPLPKESVLGNIFFTLLAGHETVGSTMGFVLVMLAIYPEAQKRIQEQLDEQLNGQPETEWSADKDYARLQKGYIGAVQKEILYLYNPASFILRKVVEAVTVVDALGKSYRVPEGTLALINLSGAARNPRVWKRPAVAQERRAALSDSPALYFNPDRWLEAGDRPDDVKGEVLAWQAFGAGGRACPGRAFAQTEMTSMMVIVFKDYGLELVVSDRALRDANGNAALAWERTRDKAIKMLYDDIEANISIGLKKELPIRIVKRIS